MFGEVDPAKALCSTCEVRSDCLGAALDEEWGFGVWGGMTFEERTRICPICRKEKAAAALGCSGPHSLLRLARLLELEAAGDPTVSVARVGPISAPTTPGCMTPRGRSHSTAKAYKEGCRCEAARIDLYRERHARPPARPKEAQEALDRFLSFVTKVDGDHWLWHGSKNGSGYPNFWDGHRVVRAHLWLYRVLVGPLPPKMRLRRIQCTERTCINPAHFEPETKKAPCRSTQTVSAPAATSGPSTSQGWHVRGVGARVPTRHAQT